MMRRKLSKKELLLVVYDTDINNENRIIKKGRVHIARYLIASGGISSSICGRSDAVRWQYPYLTWITQNTTICLDCLENLQAVGMSKHPPLVIRG